MEEQVFGVDRCNLELEQQLSAVSQIALLEGFISEVSGQAILRAIRGQGRFHARASAETDPSFKQLIPYVVLTNEAGDKFFVYSRDRQQAETRLHGRLSLGIGGHVEPRDLVAVEGKKQAAISAAAARELREEVLPDLGGKDLAGLVRIGFLNDDSNVVGSVHLGVAYVLVIPEESQAKLENQQPPRVTGYWQSLDWVRQHSSRFETWSQLLIAEFSRVQQWLEREPGEEEVSLDNFLSRMLSNTPFPAT